MDECIINKLVVNRVGVEDGKIGVFDIRDMEVGVGVGVSMQSHAIDGVTLLAASLNSHTVSYQDVTDVLSHLSLSLFIAKEELVVPLISTIEEHPVTSRMISIFLSLYISIDNADLRRGGNEEHRCFVSGAFMVGINLINEGWYPSKMDNLIVLVKGA
jgi:hypothetical protein